MAHRGEVEAEVEVEESRWWCSWLARVNLSNHAWMAVLGRIRATEMAQRAMWANVRAAELLLDVVAAALQLTR